MHDKENARSLLKYLSNAVDDAAKPADAKDAAKPADAKDAAKPAAGAAAAAGDAAKPAEDAGDDADAIMGKIDPGIAGVIPTKFNLTDSNSPLILGIQEQDGESLLKRHDLDYEDYC